MQVEVHFGVEPAALLEADGAPGLDCAGVVAAVSAAWKSTGRADVELSVALVDDSTLAELHGRCLDDPQPTDVMSFELETDALGSGESTGPVGEVIVSVDRARDVARARGSSLARELTLYLVHGTLHLCGFDDHDDAERAAMRAAEARVMASLGFEAEQLPHEHDG